MSTNVTLSPDQQIDHLFRGSALEGELREHMETELRERLKTGRPLRVKLGLDPTRPFLHIGLLAPLLALKRFADLGHRTYLLLGGFTAMIGDPAERRHRHPPLGEAEVAANAEIYKREVFRVLDPATTVMVNNATWFDSMRLIDFLNEAAMVTIAQMLSRGNFKDRFDAGQPICLQELLYPVAQAYDSMVICAAPPGREDDPEAYRHALGNPEACCDVEVGGSDQLFNFELTRGLMSDHRLTPQVFIITPLILGRDKQKMGKTKDNVVSFTDPPQVIYRRTMGVPDDLILPYMASITAITDEELRDIKRGLRTGDISWREANQRLAFEVVALLHGGESARAAQDEFEAGLYGHAEP